MSAGEEVRSGWGRVRRSPASVAARNLTTTASCTTAVLVPGALGVPENVGTGRRR